MSLIALTGALALNTTSTPLYTPTCTYRNGTHVTHTEKRVHHVYYSEEFHLSHSTVIDPFRTGAHVTVGPGPTTIVTSDQLTETVSYLVDPIEEITFSFSFEFPPVTTSDSSSTDIPTTTITTTDIPIPTPPFTMTVPASTLPISFATTCTLSTVATPSQADIANAIDKWQTDIDTINNFLVTAIEFFGYTDFNAMRLAAEQGYSVAVDEPCQFQTLQNALNVNPNAPYYADYQCAMMDLGKVFGQQVLGNLNSTIYDPTSFDTFLTRINDFRCCNVLPDVQILFNLADAINPGASPQPTNTNGLVVPIPDTCSLVDCSNFPLRSTCTPVPAP